ncbi:unnamed protein product [Heterobilharzia americana]|nr:unnamed protein product [Heterobilharzia americana]
MKERNILDVITSNKLFTEELPAAYGGYQNHWRYLDGKVIERLDYLSDIIESPSISCKPNMKRIINLLTTTVQPEILGPISRFRLAQLEQKSLERDHCRRNQRKHKSNTWKPIKCLKNDSENLNNKNNSSMKKIKSHINQYVDEIFDELKDEDELYQWSQCLPSSFIGDTS